MAGAADDTGLENGSGFFFFSDTAPSEIYTLSLHDALPISRRLLLGCSHRRLRPRGSRISVSDQDRKSTRLNSSHGYISYAVFCLKKKKKQDREDVHLEHTVTPAPTLLPMHTQVTPQAYRSH